MTHSFDRPELTEAEKTAQREARDRLVRAATLAVDVFVMDNAPLQKLMTPAAWTRLLVQATVGYLLGEGFITENPPDDDAWLALSVPDHLAPDVEGALAEARRIREALNND
jgi:hypothetical protein